MSTFTAAREKMDLRTLRRLEERARRKPEEAKQERARWGGCVDVCEEQLIVLQGMIEEEEQSELLQVNR